jgi:FlaG/FlaF family flagellin (archaellin)
MIDKLVKGLRERDSGVAVVVGTIMLIAIFISLLTAYLIWYIPYQGTFNEENYYLETQSAFTSLENKLNTNSLVPGAIITQSIPIGIMGEPPFTTQTDTSVIFSHSSSNMFSLNLSFNVTVKTQSSSVSRNFNEGFESFGLLSSSAQMQYLLSYGYAIENGLLFRDEGTQSGLLSGTHFDLTNSSDHFSLYAGILNVSGPSESVGGYGAAIFQSEFSILANTSLAVGQNTSTTGLNLVSGAITNITLSNMTYFINGSMSRAFDFGLISEYNSSAAANFSSWTFMHALQIKLTGDSLEIHNIKKLQMKVLTINYGELDILAL